MIEVAMVQRVNKSM